MVYLVNETTPDIAFLIDVLARLQFQFNMFFDEATYSISLSYRH
ncbi:hypothetical protein HanXRQr2_Chr17g0806791 [Helianthus annuus]|uniref:Uncharacterized protein n=1 Tax=Helianthus annuus TaxID=4232 RepID=A0A9K3DHZ4_HELAN|nr:hypothetical protein HanXRQr2_Chr17g0806791 [Helianthus annuus]